MSETKCPRQRDCANYLKMCMMCHDQEKFFKPSKPWQKQTPKKPKDPLGKRRAGSKKQGIDFEKRVAKKFDNAVTKKAKRVPGSGAIWSMPGDVITEEDLIECKDRSKITSSGEKQITIKKEWLEKVHLESIGTNKRPMLAFGFDGDDDIYIVMNINVLFEMIYQISELKGRIQELEGG